jgi:hypothetical protein
MNTRRNQKQKKTTKFLELHSSNFILFHFRIFSSIESNSHDLKIYMQELEEEAPACAVVPHDFTKQKL